MDENSLTSPSPPSHGQPNQSDEDSSRSFGVVPMTRLEIAMLACKILAIWTLAQAACLLGALFIWSMVLIAGIFGHQGVQWDQLAGVEVSGVMPIVMALIGAFLWFRAEGIANRMVSNDPTPVTASRVTRESILTIAIIAIGLYTLIPMLRDTSRYVVMVFRGAPFTQLWTTPDFLGLVVGLVIAIWLTFGSRRLARLLLFSRSASRNYNEDRPGA